MKRITFAQGVLAKPKLQGTAALALAFIMVLAGCQKRDSGGTAGKPAAITVEVFDRGTDGGKTNPANNAWTDWIKKKVLADENIDVTFIPIPRGEETQAINNMMAAGNAHDIMCTITLSYRTRAIRNNYGKNNVPDGPVFFSGLPTP